jgi:hypothetical protein
MSMPACRFPSAAVLAAAFCLFATLAPRTASATLFTIQNVTYDWTGTIGGVGVVERTVGTREEIRWGTPLVGDPNNVDIKSGLGMDKDFGVFGTLPFTVSDNQNFPLGKLSHFNHPIVFGTHATSAFLNVTASIQVESQNIVAGPFSFRFDIEETFNEVPCPSFQQSGTPCDDRITPFSVLPQTFAWDGKQFTITITGFCVTCTGESLLPAFITEEGGVRNAFLVAQIVVTSAVAEPEALALFGPALAGFAALRRRRRA